MQIWLNGHFVDRADARVSVFDAGLQHGVGLFETIGASGGRLVRGPEHIRRLIGSARSLGLTERLREQPLLEAVEQTLQRSGLEAARVRLTVTGGDLSPMPAQNEARVDPTILVVAQPATEYPPAFFEQGVTVVIADGRANPLDPMGGHKTLNYWPRIRALQQAAAARAGEAIWFTVSNHLASGSVSNVFVVDDGELFTPAARGEEVAGALPAPVLPGITRAAILELAAQIGLPVHRRMLDIERLLGAEEVFLTNSSWGVLPVVAVERQQIGDGLVGDYTRRLREAWLAEI